MYLVRRTNKVKPGTYRKVAELMVAVGAAYEKAGQLNPTRIYWSGGTVPGVPDQVYIDWLTDKIESPLREGNVIPDEVIALGRELREYRESTWIDFFQMAPLPGNGVNERPIVGTAHYLIRRTYKVKPRTHMKAAEIAHQITLAYEKAGQRNPTRIYWSGNTVPGPANHIYLDWVAEKLESPYRKGNDRPDVTALGTALGEYREDTSIDFFQLAPRPKPA